MKLFYCFDGNVEDDGIGEGWIPEPKFAFRTKEACERYIASKLAKERKEKEGEDKEGEDDNNNDYHNQIGSMNVAGNPSQVFELLIDGDGCACFMGLFANKSQAEARAAKMKRDEIKEFGHEMNTESSISAVEVLDEFIE